jgi:hypothetical protein
VEIEISRLERHSRKSWEWLWTLRKLPISGQRTKISLMRFQEWVDLTWSNHHRCRNRRTKYSHWVWNCWAVSSGKHFSSASCPRTRVPNPNSRSSISSRRADHLCSMLISSSDVTHSLVTFWRFLRWMRWMRRYWSTWRGWMYALETWLKRGNSLAPTCWGWEITNLLILMSSTTDAWLSTLLESHSLSSSWL